MKQPQGNHFLAHILAKINLKVTTSWLVTNNLQVTTSWLIYVFYPIWITASMARKKYLLEIISLFN